MSRTLFPPGGPDQLHVSSAQGAPVKRFALGDLTEVKGYHDGGVLARAAFCLLYAAALYAALQSHPPDLSSPREGTMQLFAVLGLPGRGSY